jgi:hypothetical protein
VKQIEEVGTAHLKPRVEEMSRAGATSHNDAMGNR